MDEDPTCHLCKSKNWKLEAKREGETRIGVLVLVIEKERKKDK